MGDPRKLRNKFDRPKKLWDVDRIRHESAIKREYGLKNMSEIWRASGELRKYRREARRLLSLTEEERKDDAEKILRKLARFSILKEGSVVDDVLGLEVRSLLERRLQTLVLRKGLARTMSQARQLVTHGFIGLNGRRVTRPGYMVTMEEEPSILHIRPIDLSIKPEEEAEAKPSGSEAPKEETEQPEPRKEEAQKPEAPKEEAKPEAEQKPEAQPEAAA